MSRTRLVTTDRRTVLKTLGVAAAGTLAGCAGSASSGDSAESSGGDGGDTAGTTGTPTATDGSGGADSTPDSGSSDGATTGDDSGSGAGSSVSFDGWFDGVANFDGVSDRTGQSEVAVTVGAEGNGGAYAFAPAAVRVSPGTTVVWTWTGEGASHDVVAEDGRFESELVAEEDHTFSHTFEGSGTVKYACTPHRALGMKGAVVVEG
ncbi:halocyanin domain-containing protein [Salinigranum rubrum]|uniref:Halocyanin domain-containing protein n=1 Tax=Salinigranum rubrum TaxID=755307 RepID=A0A2I8VK82_9EURY|nr:halocyanin domain-containing protein [Salinigranum rubrum]AUV82304.1 halocyanin domain-containing protein [Salinigranum rubrum]